ncbi:hypothetical protein QYE76_011386 [Lolium multiflorum]|uniref:Integrase catalytic domain-containing protein n=1 Tax=Lolium multiflorum TaxID=4521 RepID=A0AAD8TZ12_LOLMU|nr:hypothetical protein QYE76_011386 [Lolium multiflorum]
MDMAFGKFHFRVGKEGSHRLARSDSARSSAAGSDSSGSVSSFKSGDEEISSAISTKLASSGELLKIFSNISVGSFADSNISSDSDSIDAFDFVDRSTSIREVFADLYDGVTDIDDNQASTRHQVYAIEEASRAEPETSEAFDDAGNPYVDPADLRRGFDVSRVFIDGGSSLNLITMPFGLKNAGATYQRMMQKCLATQIGKNIQVYIDDVVITTKEGSTLIDDLRETFDNLDRFCLKLNCSFGVPAGELLGFLVSARGIEANPEKIQAIVTMRKPTKLKEIQQLTGRVAALSRFIARVGEKALPFYALIKQGEKFEWNEEADRAFEDLKHTISTPPILVAPKDKEPLLLYIAATPQWGLDMVGKLHKAWPGGYEYMLVAVDKFTKWVEAKPINSPDAASAIKFIKSIVFRFGVRHSIVTDNGSNFTSKEFKACCAEVGIKLHFASVAHPQTNGQVEKANGVICNGIKKRLLGPLEQARHTWPEELPSVLWSIRTTPNTTTQETPFFLVHGAEAVLPIEIEHNSPRVAEFDEETSRKALEDGMDALDEARDEVLSRVAKYQQDMKNYHSRRLRPRSF